MLSNLEKITWLSYICGLGFKPSLYHHMRNVNWDDLSPCDPSCWKGYKTERTTMQGAQWVNIEIHIKSLFWSLTHYKT